MSTSLTGLKLVGTGSTVESGGAVEHELLVTQAFALVVEQPVGVLAPGDCFDLGFGLAGQVLHVLGSLHPLNNSEIK